MPVDCRGGVCPPEKKCRRRGREDALSVATSHAEPYSSKLTTAFGGLANFILIDKQSKGKYAIILSLPNKKDRLKINGVPLYIIKTEF